MIQTSRLPTQSSSTPQAVPRSALEQSPLEQSPSQCPPPSGAKSHGDASDQYKQVSALAQVVTTKWRTDSQLDLTPELRELWGCFCDAGMHPEAHQQLVDFLKSILETSKAAESNTEESGVSFWKDLPQFKVTVEQKLHEAFTANQETKTRWITLNHLLARISIPPASIYDLRMVCLWNLRDVLETSSVSVDVDMLKILMLWLGGHIHWLQLQILRAHSTNYPDDSLVTVELGDLAIQTNESLQSRVDLARLRFWRQQLKGLFDADASNDSIKFYADAVLKLLEVGIARVDEWKEEIPTA